ncbi:DUF58 domain-containing protein [Clavibacter nebraskensis]|uniref:Conserved membrane protein n=4 Tax=Clavibacter nebraskensis TaxID=31963 RepID=A0AAI9EK58_9MICO|nr:hypothetical protein VV38_06215 [Clavibacter nebraskensis]CCE75275.1 conserved membrane protein [Clavibacter nebraskensis NCPPB 2581]OAH22408.1 hypothetical protein A3Q38_02350 [Clavibacter nebraskensis]QGV68078.1 DUF58 domain-containing protein [Clavibacter nebraskensis]QGV70871.1 DUF58 domain-containing protein [Clavibacter nebraskensis]
MRRIGVEAVPHPTLRGIALLAAGVAAFAGAFIAGRREFVFIGVALLALPLLAAVWLVIARVRLHVERTFTSEVVESGTATTVTVSVANAGSMPTPRSWVLDLVPGSDGAMPPAELPSLRGLARGSRRSTARPVLRYDLTPERRGVHEVGPLAVEEHDPFRLMGLRHVAGGTSRLVVTPRLADLEAEPGGQVSSEGESERVQRRADGGEDDLGTREYRAGDPLRRVHWRATARHGELMVRQEEQRSSPRSLVLLDTRAAGYPPHDDDGDGDRAFERAVAFAASVAVHLQRGGYAVHLIETAAGSDRQAPVAARPGDAAAEGDLLLHLAEVRPAAVDADRDGVQEALSDLRRSRRAVPIHAVLGHLDEHEARRLAGFGAACRPAVAFLAHPGRVDGRDDREALRILREAGWRTVVLGDGTRPADAWRAARAEEMAR